MDINENMNKVNQVRFKRLKEKKRSGTEKKKKHLRNSSIISEEISMFKTNSELPPVLKNQRSLKVKSNREAYDDPMYN